MRSTSSESPPLASLKGFSTVAICATHFAFSNLGLDAGPSTALREQVRYLICFVTAYMVEFEDADIEVAAIDAGMITEVDTHHLIAFSCLLTRLGTAPTSVSLNCFDAVAVGATHFALSDLCFDGGPVKAPGKKIGYPAGFLPIDVIKLKKAYICLTTIDAGMCGEV